MPIKNKRSDSLISKLFQLWGHLSRRRHAQLGLLLLLLIITSLSEMLSLGAIFPFLSALSNAQNILEAPSLQTALDFLSIQTPSQLVRALAIGFVLAVVIANTLRISTLRLQLQLAAAIGTDISSQIYNTFLRQPYSFHMKQNSSDLIQTITTDTNRLTNNVLVQLLQFLSQSMLACSLITTLLLIDSKIALGAAGVLGTAYFLIYRSRHQILKKNSRIISESGQQKIKIVQEGAGGIRDILLCNSQNFFNEVYLKAEKSFKYSQVMNSFVAESPRYLIEAIALSAIAFLALGLGQEGDFSQAVPILGSLGLGAQRLLPALQKVFRSVAEIQGGRVSLIRVLEALDGPDNFLSCGNDLVPLQLRQELKLEQVYFRYSEVSNWTLKDINITINARTTVGIVGGTGSGKTTTADILMGLLQPQKGFIWADKVLLNDENLRLWQAGIAHVPQHIFLSDRTLLENIAFGIPKRNINLAQVERAAKLAKLKDFIDDLPAGYETYVGERGIRLSGGQRQRIGIARALYKKDVSVIIFDEATSALDNSTEREVMSAIEELSGEFTIILIAHRLSTVKRCDLIVELRKGEIVAQGSYDELLKKSNSFKQMVDAS